MDLHTLRTNIANKVRKLRKSHGHSQENLSELLKCGKERVSRLERCLIALPEDMLLRLARIYNVEPDYFYDFSEPSEDKEALIEELGKITGNYSLSKLKKLIEIAKIF